MARLEQLGFNALLQLMIGVPLEMVHGLLRISLLYLRVCWQVRQLRALGPPPPASPSQLSPFSRRFPDRLHY